MSEKQKTVETVVKQPAAQSTIKRFFELLFMLFSAILVLFSWDSARKVIIRYFKFKVFTKKKYLFNLKEPCITHLI